jgi:lysophospholipase L1-like esterase
VTLVLLSLFVLAFAWAEEVLFPDYLVWPPGMRHENHPAAGIFTGIKGPSRFETNSLGIRGPEMGDDGKREYRILFLGGSATECFYLDQLEAWPALSGTMLPRTADGRPVWVGNAGRSGHNSRDHVMEMRHLIPKLRIDRVVVQMGVNDLGLRLAQGAAYNPEFLASEENVEYQLRHAFSVRPEDPNLPFYRKGYLGRLLGLRPDAPRPKPHQIVDEAGHAFARWREFRWTGKRVSELPPMGAALGEFARNAEEILRLGKGSGVDVVFLTQPALWRNGLTEAERRTLWMGGIGDFQAEPGAVYYTAGALAEALAAYNRTILEVCARTGTACLDLAPGLKQDLSVFYDDCHFNESGARQVGKAVAEFLKAREPFRDSATERPRSLRPAASYGSPRESP